MKKLQLNKEVVSVLENQKDIQGGIVSGVPATGINTCQYPQTQAAGCPTKAPCQSREIMCYESHGWLTCPVTI